MAILPSMGLETAAISGDRGTWGGKVNSNMTKIDAHTHVSGQGEQVPVAGMLIDDDLSFNNTFGCTDLHAITFASIVALSDNEYNKSLFVSNGTGGLINGELYWRNTSGNHVQLTSGNSLNVSAFVGGIGGDYSSVSALLDYDDSTKTYRLRQQVGSSVRQFARTSTGGVRLFEFKASPSAGVPTQSVLLSSPAALASSYTVTFPTALPASTSVLMIDSGGQLSSSSALSGTLTYRLAAADFDIEGAAQSAGTALLGDGQWTFGAIEVLTSGINLPNGCVITGYDIYANRGGSGNIIVTLCRKTLGTKTTINTTTINSGTGMVKTAGSSTNLPHTMLIDNEYYIRVSCDAATNVFEHIEVRYTI